MTEGFGQKNWWEYKLVWVTIKCTKSSEKKNPKNVHFCQACRLKLYFWAAHELRNLRIINSGDGVHMGSLIWGDASVIALGHLQGGSSSLDEEEEEDKRNGVYSSFLSLAISMSEVSRPYATLAE